MKAKLICGIIRSRDCAMERITALLEKGFGPIDFTSSVVHFDLTSYYEEEMGPDLKREWVSFKHLIDAGELARIKLGTVGIERVFARPDHTRTANLDPGYVTLSSFVLASTKDFSHRIYLRDGISAEISLVYEDHHFHGLEWTYPDYKANLSTFEHIRSLFKNQQKHSPLPVAGSKDERCLPAGEAGKTRRETKVETV